MNENAVLSKFDEILIYAFRLFVFLLLKMFVAVKGFQCITLGVDTVVFYILQGRTSKGYVISINDCAMKLTWLNKYCQRI